MRLMKSLLLGSAATWWSSLARRPPIFRPRRAPRRPNTSRSARSAPSPASSFPAPAPACGSAVTSMRRSPWATSRTSQIKAVDQAGAAEKSTTSAAKYVSDVGFSTRGQVNFDAVTNTALGPLLAHIEIQANSGTGLRPARQRARCSTPATCNGPASRPASTARSTIISPAATPGRTSSRPTTAARRSICSPSPRPSAAASRLRCLLEQNKIGRGRRTCRRRHHSSATPARNYNGSGAPLGVRAPDIVAALDLTQRWGGAHLAGVAHNIRSRDRRHGVRTRSDLDAWGYGAIGGVTFNLPMLSAGSKIAFQGAYAHGAIGYPARPRRLGASRTRASTPTATARCSRWRTRSISAATRWSLSDAWSAAAQLTWKLSPNFEIDPEVAYASVDYGAQGQSFSTHAVAEGDGVVGRRGVRLVAGQESRFRPRRRLQEVASGDALPLGPGADGPFQNDSDGFNGRLHVARSF